MEDEQPQQDIPPTVEQPEAEIEPTKTVKNFWERLDEVFELVKSGGAVNNKVDELLENFPEFQRTSSEEYKSFIFQPERISLSSNDDTSTALARSNSLSTSGHVIAERFSSFKINFKKPLRNVKSIQLLSAVIPNATQNIPDQQVCFFYYKIRSTEDAFLGEWNNLTTYNPGDIVGISALNKNYACKTRNLNIDPATTYWTSIVYWIPTTQQATNAWSGLVTYNPGDIVVYVNKNYICVTGNIAINPGPAIDTWNSTTFYYANTKIFYNGIQYTCVNDNAGVIPDVTYWVEINLGITPTIPNYYDLNPYHMQVVYLFPTFGNLPESTTAANYNSFNRTYQDYNDLVNALNFCVANNGNGANTNSAIPNDITFQYNATLNRIVMVPNPTEIASGYYYMPCGYDDYNFDAFFKLTAAITFFGENLPGIFAPQTILNTRLGFTWNGVFTDPFNSPDTLYDVNFANNLYFYLRPKNPLYPVPWVQNIITANSYCDLVNTSSVRIYTDVTFGSTEDSESQSGLLSVVPVSALNLGVAFYQNNFNNELTKIPRNIPEISIFMFTDNGLPYYLPNSATVLLELAINYY